MPQYLNNYNFKTIKDDKLLRKFQVLLRDGTPFDFAAYNINVANMTLRNPSKQIAFNFSTADSSIQLLTGQMIVEKSSSEMTELLSDTYDYDLKWTDTSNNNYTTLRGKWFVVDDMTSSSYATYNTQTNGYSTNDDVVIVVENVLTDFNAVIRLAVEEVHVTEIIVEDGGTAGFALYANDADKLDNQHGSYYLNRANHTGTQTSSTISDFTPAVNALINASANSGTSGFAHEAAYAYQAGYSNQAGYSDYAILAQSSNYASTAGFANVAANSYLLEGHTYQEIIDQISGGGDASTAGFAHYAGYAYDYDKTYINNQDAIVLQDAEDYTDAAIAAIVFPDASTAGYALNAANAYLLNNQNGAYYLNRANHTGTQLVSTISDIGTASVAYANNAFHATIADSTNYSMSSGYASSSGNANNLNSQPGSYYLNRTNHTGTQLAATISDFTSAVNALIPPAPTYVANAGTSGWANYAGYAYDADKLDNQDGTFYLSRANHTGTQTSSTISDFTTSVQALIPTVTNIAGTAGWATNAAYSYNANLLDGIDSTAFLQTSAISGTTNRLTKYASSSTLGNSSITDDGSTVTFTLTSSMQSASVAGTFAQSGQYAYLGDYNTGSGTYPIGGSSSNRRLATAWNFSNGNREMDLWNTDYSGQGFHFRQLTGASAQTLLASLNNNGDLSLTRDLSVGRNAAITGTLAVTSTTALTGLASYGSDLSGSYTTRSLVDKEYVDRKTAVIATLSSTTTIDATYAGKVIECTGTFTLTLPNSMTNGMQVTIINVSTGVITIAASTTLQTKGSYTKLASQYSAASAYHRGSNVWAAFGDLTA